MSRFVRLAVTEGLNLSLSLEEDPASSALATGEQGQFPGPMTLVPLKIELETKIPCPITGTGDRALKVAAHGGILSARSAR